MDVVEFGIDHTPYARITIAINGTPLVDLARIVEQPWAIREGRPHLAGNYVGMAPAEIGGSASHFLATPRATWFGDGDTVLLGCDCGAWGCWPLTADISVSDGGVSWHHFRHGHRDWDLSALGPFRFGRADYDRALRVLERKMRMVQRG